MLRPSDLNCTGWVQHAALRHQHSLSYGAAAPATAAVPTGTQATRHQLCQTRRGDPSLPGSAAFMVRLHHIGGLFQPKRFCDSINEGPAGGQQMLLLHMLTSREHVEGEQL